MNEINQALVSGGAVIVVAVIALIAAVAIKYSKYGIDLLKQKASSIEDENTRNLVNSTLDRLSSLTEVVVTSIEQESTKAIKDSIASGKTEYTYDDILALKDQAVDRVKEQLTPEMINAINEQVSDIDKFISDLVSTSVYKLHESQPIMVEGITESVDNSQE